MTSQTHVAQVGGSHYGGGNNQHWDLAGKYDLPYLLANGTSYVMRWDRKGTPVQDLEKALSYLVKWQKLWPEENARVVSYDIMVEFWNDNHLGKMNPVESEKRLILELVHVDGTPKAIASAIFHLKTIIERERWNQEVAP